jgi:predicted XRE-type DNA-binding protein
MLRSSPGWLAPPHARDITCDNPAFRDEVSKMVIQHITPVGGNVFADLGFVGEEAENLKIRSRLMMEIHRVIEARGLKQRDAARLFGVSQPRITSWCTARSTSSRSIRWSTCLRTRGSPSR